MSTQINIEELKTLIANGIKEQNLHEALPEDAVEKIKERILAMRDRESEKEIPQIVSELDIPSLNYTTDQDANFPENEMTITGTPLTFKVDAGAVPTEQMSEPVMGYTPELPEMLKKAEPAELFVFKYTDINQSGENLSNKPMRLMDDPDVKKSMHDLWIQEGKTKAKVYVAKFEEIGEIEFNYTDGTSKFTDKASEPDYVGGPSYQENPYAEPSLPQIEGTTKAGLETYIKNSIDLEGVVKNIVMDILKTSLMNPSELSKSENQYALGAIDPNNPNIPTDEKGYYVNENTNVDEEFSLTMEDIVKNDDYVRVALPSGLNESIDSGDKSKLIKENDFIQEWEFDGERFFIPVDRISKNKGYKKV